MKQWFTEMWPDCSQFLKLMGIIYGLLWVMCVIVMVFDGGFSFWVACWNVSLVLLIPAILSMLGFLSSTLPTFK